MRARRTRCGRDALLAVAMLLASTAEAHRLDEYLQATLFSVERQRVEIQMRLTPGVAVLPAVLAGIDSDADGALSDAEQRRYAQKVVGDLSLRVDGDALPLELVSLRFPKMEQLREGVGEMQLELRAKVPAGGTGHKLTFHNRHQSGISVYLTNALVPRDPNIQIAAQDRNSDQSLYELEYRQPGESSRWWPWTAAVALLLTARFALTRRRGGRLLFTRNLSR